MPIIGVIICTVTCLVCGIDLGMRYERDRTQKKLQELAPVVPEVMEKPLEPAPLPCVTMFRYPDGREVMLPHDGDFITQCDQWNQQVSCIPWVKLTPVNYPERQQ